ncbi:MAG: LVIVD repeat-containing protein [Candidatus Heimdallarchaeota archaeon]
MKHNSHLILLCLLIISLSPFTAFRGQNSDRELVLSKIGELPTGGDAYDVWIDEDRELAVLTCGYYGVRIVNVSDPSNPIELSHIPEPPAVIETGHTTGYAHQFYLDQKMAYVGDGAAGLTVIDTTDPRNPSIISHYSGGYAWDIEVQQAVAFVSSGFLGNGAGLLILDFSNPTSPILMANYSTEGDITSVEVKGDLAFLADYDKGLVVLDVSNASNPVLKEEFPGPQNSGVSYVEVADNLLYSTSWTSGLRIWNITVPSEISIVADYSKFESYFSVRVFDDYAFLGGMNDGLIVLNVSDPVNPVEIGRYSEGGRVNSAYAVNNLIYVADQDSGLLILKIQSSIDTTSAAQTSFGSEIIVIGLFLFLGFKRKRKGQ